MSVAARAHWPCYVIEAWGLGTFMFVAGAVAAGLRHIPLSPLANRAAFGLAMGTTVVALVYSPWGRRSGAHLNPSLTLAYAWLQKLAPWDAACYVVAQFAGAAIGFSIATVVFGASLSDAPVHDIVTKPGPAGIAVAFAAEFAMTFLLMSVVLGVSNARPALARFTGVCAALLVAGFITLEAPFSGMSLNPARTFASALAAHDWTALWLYFTAPPLGMFVAAFLFVRLRGRRAVKCGRLCHDPRFVCIFRCGYGAGELERARTF